MKNINEELNYMKYLFGYKKGVVISEQEFKEADDDVTTSQTTEDPAYKTVTKTIGGKFGGDGFGMRGVQRGGVNAGVTFSYSKEIDKNLDSAGDVLQKMNADLAEDKNYTNLPAEDKLKLAQGYYDAIELLINGQDYSKYDIKNKRKLKKFFKKAQRWKFEPEELPKKIEKKYVNPVGIQVTTDTKDLESLNMIKQQVNDAIDQLNDNNSKPEIILGSEGSLFTYLNTGEIEGFAQPKEPLTAFYTRISVDVEAKEVKPESEKAVFADTEVNVNNVPVEFGENKYDPSPFMTKVMNEVYNNFYNTSVTFENVDGESKTMTIKDMIDCGDQKCKERFDIYITGVNVVSSASNAWAKGEVLDITHKNDGTFVKTAEELNAAGNNAKNFKLAKQRGDGLIQAVLQEFQKGGPIRLYKDFDYTKNIQMEYRVTDTGGKVDSDPTKDKTNYPNKGQYAQFKFDVGITIMEKKTSPSVNELEGQIKQGKIVLKYIGKQGGGFGIKTYSFGGGKMKSSVFKRTITGKPKYMNPRQQQRRRNWNYKRTHI